MKIRKGTIVKSMNADSTLLQRGIVVGIRRSTNDRGLITHLKVAFDGESPKWVDMSEADLEYVMPCHWVNVYLWDRAYGGPEEGGWWYDVHEPVKSYWCSSEEGAQKLCHRLRRKAMRLNEHRTHPSSVASDGHYTVILESERYESATRETPHYE